MASLHQLKRTAKRAYRRVGRGQGSKRGKQAGRGGKGQTARAGHKIRPALRDIIKKLPKRRGYGKNRARTVNSSRRRAVAVSLARIATAYEAGTSVTVATLKEQGLISARSRDGVKVVGAEISKKLSFSGMAFSAAARVAIEKAGGSIA